MSKFVPDWINTLALDIYKIIQRYKAMPRFQEMVNTWAEDHEAEIANEITWNKQRASHFEKNVATNDRLQNEQAGPPEDGWHFESYVQHIEKQTESGFQRSENLIHGWVPHELSILAEQEITSILPLKHDHELTLTEKYTIFAAVYDYGRKGTEGMPPWQWPGLDDWDKPNALSNAKRGIFFENLCDSVSKLRRDDEGWLRVLLEDVKEDIDKWAGEQSPDLKEEQTEMAPSKTLFSRNIKTILNNVYLWLKKHYRKIITIIIVLLSASNIPNLIDWLKPIKIIARPVEISYALKDVWPVRREGRIEHIKGVSYYAKIYLTALNKSYRVSDVAVFIVLEPDDEPREGKFRRSSPPTPSSDTLDIQHLRFLEKDKDYLCYVDFFLEGEQKDNYSEMTFERIELRLYGDDGKYKKVNLYHSDFSEY